MKRGDLVTIAVSGDYGKPRPALVVQDDAFAALPSVTVLQLTSDVHEEHLIRITVRPDEENGLRKPSQIMIDRAVTLPRAKIGTVFGHVDTQTIKSVDAALGRFFGIGRQ
ncbi:type II toxin-antitoxin system PemK/MazF family toxin [Rhodospirillum rubrum]|uniref:Transcriptional modulator of MazE/toxin, MazF n=1 Tax=Rhodospirillum rubrum (strain ATCC 11170 / ATH 1.1.1 / DSM 467 / LMG 4362 / NCIMB 8255 / S1) TaxID=269796 RepID=Q2RVR8_RHORT|nr:type II toxin-antitoxin system PemK/MazF family toxin [Rhodospirillum rubrum]ABC21777.1 transcriptional modulator of MazE/toxin, MazF [Rhodospirillum rubrum ATCC 11170]AEO47477.1 transcriptional modulator of MazE/toxin, MazF [Rhodospirillum rubrum F11]MBK5953335.1 MazF/PemK family toxin [Rhodospirillum rubrum]QXG81441.1 type II toxin-antitoxin system PemK/MazF family toxin [Rhodospirillum rubrum]